MSSRPFTLVACGVLFNDQDECLIGSRPEGKPMAGWWEFPGGKMEFGETPHATLVREMKEELGLVVRSSAPWVTITHDYPHALVKLHFLRSWDWSGVPRSLEGQSFGFFDKEHWPEPMLAATAPIREWLRLPISWLRLESPKERVLEALVALDGRSFDGIMLGENLASEIDFWRDTCAWLGVREIWVSAKAAKEIQMKADGVYLETPEDLSKASHGRIAGPATPDDWRAYQKRGVLFAWAEPTIRVASSAWSRLLTDNPLPIYLTGVKLDHEKHLRPHGAQGWIESV